MQKATMSLLGGILLSALHVSAADLHSQESARVRWANQELAHANKALASTTNTTEIALQESRIDLAEMAIQNYRTQSELKRIEKSLSTARNQSPNFVLRKALSAIITDELAPKTAASAHNIKIQELKDRRDQEEQRRIRMANDPRATIAAQAWSESRILNIDTEIMAVMLARDTEEYKLRLAREAKRLDTLISSVEKEVRITLRILLGSHRKLTHNLERQEEFAVIRQELESQASESFSAVEITQQRVEQLKQEISILNHRSRVERESDGAADSENRVKRGMFKKLFGSDTKAGKQLERMIKDVEEAIELLSQRLVHLQNQSVSIHHSLSLVIQGSELLAAEYAHIDKGHSVLKRRYTRRIMLPTVTIALVTIIYLTLSHLLLPLMLKQNNLFIARRLGSYGVILIVVLILISFFLEDLKHIATIMGLVGAAIVIALQDMCSAFAGWFVIVASRKLRVGDRVEINGNRGEIIDIQILRTTLSEINNWLDVDEATGRTLIIPNSFIFKSDVFNYSHIHPYIWGKVDITVTFESIPALAYGLLFEILREETGSAYAAAKKGGEHMAKQYGVSRGIYDPHIHTVIADSGICYSLYYVAHYRRFTTMRDKIMTRVIDAVNETPGVEFAYPTERHIPTPPALPPVEPKHEDAQ